MTKIVTISPEDNFYPKNQLAAWSPDLPALHRLGTLDLLHLSLTAWFYSRKCSRTAILKAQNLALVVHEKTAPVINGFYTPSEKDMLNISLKENRSILICSAQELVNMRIASALRKGVKHG